MNDLDRMTEALVAADAAGDTDAARALAGAIRQARAGSMRPASRTRSFVTGLGDPIQGGAQLLANALPEGIVSGVNRATAAANELPVIGPAMKALGMVPATPQQVNDQVTAREADYQSRRDAGGDSGFDGFRTLGNMAAMAVPAARLPVGGSVMGSVAAGAGQGAALSALTPVPGATEDTYAETKKDQAISGGIAGAIAGPVAYGIGRAIAPNIDDNVRALSDAGVEMTPGQMLGGMARRVENASTSLPIVGDRILAAQNRSIETFNRSVANRVLSPLNQQIDDTVPAGREMVAEVGKRISDGYNAVLPRITLRPDNDFAADVSALASKFLTPSNKEAFEKAIQDNIVSRTANGVIDGPTYQTIKSELGTLASSYRSSQMASERELGRAFGDLQKAFQDLLYRSNPMERKVLRGLDQAYAGYTRLVTAGANSAAKDGVFSPSNLNQAVRQGDRSLRKSAYAKGDAVMQDLSDAAKSVLPSNINDSGTTTRAALNAATLAAGGMGAMSGMIDPTYLGAGALAMGAYSNPAQRAVQAFLMTQRPDLIAQIGRGLSGSGGLLAGPAVGALSQPP